MFTIGGLSGVVLANASPFGDIAFHRRRHLLRSKSFSLRFEYGVPFLQCLVDDIS